MRLSALANATGLPLVGEGDPEIASIVLDSRAAKAGALFVAIPGSTVDGSRFIPDALRSGAVAVCSTSAYRGAPTLVSPDPRRDLALLAAELHGHPAREMRLIGVTGSLGKTSTALLAEAALTGGETPVGVIGSLGIRIGGTVIETGMTTPEAPAIHGALRTMVSSGTRTAVMEVTSHSLELHRVVGLEFAIGALTNIVPDEHLEFHPTMEHYVRTKASFLSHLAPGAPLIVNADCAISRRITRGRGLNLVDLTFDGAEDAQVRGTVERATSRGSEVVLQLSPELRTVDGEPLGTESLRLRIPLLGAQQVSNASMAALMALHAGCRPEAVARGLAATRPIRRRMEILRPRAPMILDDTVGNAESIRAVFQAAREVPHGRLRVVYAIRGTRGPVINTNNAEMLAREIPSAAELIVTASEDATGARDVVRENERDAVLDTLGRNGVTHRFVPRLEDAVAAVLDHYRPDDLVLLLGAQGMDRGAEYVRKLLPDLAEEAPAA